MNISWISSFLASLAVFLLSVYFSFDNPLALIDGVSVLIVVGGSLTMTLTCFSPKLVMNLLKVFAKRTIGRYQIDYGSIITEIGELSKASKKGKATFEQTIKTTKHPFLKEGAEILYWIEADITPDELRNLLETRVKTTFDNYMLDSSLFKSVAKYPPTFGMMGTTIGMIALLQSMGGSNENLGKSMAIALITTLYGLVGSNLALVPIAEHLAKQAREEKTARVMIVEGLMLIQEGKPTMFVEEKVKSYLLPSARPKGGKVSKAA